MSVAVNTMRSANTGQRISELETALQDLEVIGTDLRQLRAIVQRLEAIEQQHVGQIERSEREFAKLIEETAASRAQLAEQVQQLEGDYEARVAALDACAQLAVRQAEEWALAAQQARAQFDVDLERARQATQTVEDRFALALGDLHRSLEDWKVATDSESAAAREAERTRNGEWRAAVEESFGDSTKKLRDMTRNALQEMQGAWNNWRESAETAQATAAERQQSWEQQFAATQFRKLDDVLQAYQLLSARQQESDASTRGRWEQADQELAHAKQIAAKGDQWLTAQINTLQQQLNDLAQQDRTSREMVQEQLTRSQALVARQIKALRTVELIALPALLLLASLALGIALFR